MAELRDNYLKSDIKLSLINELRTRPMTRKDIQNFLSQERIRLGKVPINCANPAFYKVCDRTVRRVIGAIIDTYGDQMEFNKAFGTYKLDLLDFPDTIDDMEIQALDIALQKMGNNKNAKKLLERLKAKLTTRLYRKIEHSEPKRAARKINEIDEKINANYAFVGPRLIIDFDENVKNILDSAISKQCMVQFTYHEHEITVCPLGIIYGPNNVYLIAYLYKNEQIIKQPRHYILSDIVGLKETKNRFSNDDNFSIKEYAESMFGIYNDGIVYDVEWLIQDPITIQVAKKYQFHPKQQFQENPDGTLTVRMRTGGLQAMSTFLAQWDGKIIPIQPQELIVKYKELLQNCMNSIKE